MTAASFATKGPAPTAEVSWEKTAATRMERQLIGIEGADQHTVRVCAALRKFVLGKRDLTEARTFISEFESGLPLGPNGRKNFDRAIREACLDAMRFLSAVMETPNTRMPSGQLRSNARANASKFAEHLHQAIDIQLGIRKV